MRVWGIPGYGYNNILVKQVLCEAPIVKAAQNDTCLTYFVSSVELTDIASKKVRPIFGKIVYPVRDSSISSNGNFIVCLTSGRGVRIFNKTTGNSRLLKLLGACSIAINSESSLLAVGLYKGTIKIYNIRTGKLRKTFKGYGKPIEFLAFSCDNRFLIMGYPEDTITIIKSENGEVVKNFSIDDLITALAISPDGVFVAALCSNTNTIHIWNVNTDKYQSIKCAGVISMAFSPDSSSLAYGTRDGSKRGSIAFFELYNKGQNHECLMKLVEYAYSAHNDKSTINLSEHAELKEIYDGFCDEFRQFLDAYITFNN